MDVLHWLLALGCLTLGALWWGEALHRRALEGVRDAACDRSAACCRERDAANHSFRVACEARDAATLSRDAFQRSAAWWQARAESATKELDAMRDRVYAAMYPQDSKGG